MGSSAQYSCSLLFTDFLSSHSPPFESSTSHLIISYYIRVSIIQTSLIDEYRLPYLSSLSIILCIYAYGLMIYSNIHRFQIDSQTSWKHVYRSTYKLLRVISFILPRQRPTLRDPKAGRGIPSSTFSIYATTVRKSSVQSSDYWLLIYASSGHSPLYKSAN